MVKLVYTLVVSSFLSLTAFEILCGISLIRVFWKAKMLLSRGLPELGLVVYGFSTLAGTFAFNPQASAKALEQALLPLTGILGKEVNPSQDVFKGINLTIFVLGNVSLLVALIRYFTQGEFKPIWGGPFEAGFLSSLLALSCFVYAVIYKEKKKLLIAFFAAGTAYAFLTLIISKRSPLLALILCLGLLVVVLRSFINLRLVFVGSAALLLAVGVGFMYMKDRDERFQRLYEVITLKSSPDRDTMNRILSNRVYLFERGLEVVKEDWKESRVLNLLVGHGVRPGFGLNLKRGDHREGSYESFVFFSEFIERGLIGLLGILVIYVSFFKTLFGLRLQKREQLVAIPSLFLLGLHLTASLFTYFWDALLPLHLLTFFMARKFYRVKS